MLRSEVWNKCCINSDSNKSSKEGLQKISQKFSRSHTCFCFGEIEQA